MNKYSYKNTSEELNNGGYDFNIANDYHYIKIGATNVQQLQQAGILPNKTYTNLLQNKPDGLILFGKSTVKVLVEYKKQGIINSIDDAKSVLTNWYFELAKKLNCKVICASDGINYFYFNENKQLLKIDSNNEFRESLNLVEITKQVLTLEKANEIIEIIDRLEKHDTNGVLIKESSLNPTDLANKVWQTLFVNTGKEPEKCLYNVVEIFIFKFLSDIGILEDDMSFEYIYNLSKKDKEKAIKRYATNIRTEIKNEMFPKSPIDGTTIFNGTIFVNEFDEPVLAQKDLFAEVLEIFKKYEKENGTFSKIDKSFKTRLYESFLRQSAGISSLGQYFTPRNVVVSMIKMINPETIPTNAKICDPFCGVGGFILELLNQIPILKENFKPINGKISSKIEILGYDKGTDEKDDERTIILAKANMLIYFADYLKQYKNCLAEFSVNAFNSVFHLIKTNLGTFGIDHHKDYFDLILTNPPYVTSGTKTIKNAIKDNGLNELYPSNGTGLEGLALDWIVNSLKPNGKAFIVVPDGVLCRQSDILLRKNLIDKCIINAIISLPTRTFYATPKKTYILVITKKQTPIQQNIPVFTYLVSDIGETKDAKRFEIENNDLDEMARLYRQFIAMPNDFKSTSLRCKLQNIQRFKNTHWLIDRDWSDEEKKELKIEEEVIEINENEFYESLNEFSNNKYTNEQSSKKYNYKIVELDSIIDFSKAQTNNSSFTKKFVHENKGNIPVYGASKIIDIPSYGYIKDGIEEVKYFQDCLTWHIDGSLGCHYREGKFTLSEKVIPLFLKDEYKDKIDLKYLSFKLIEKANELGFSREYKPNQTKLKSVEITIPINEENEFDVFAQKEIALRYEQIENTRKNIVALLNRIENAQIKIEL